MKITFDWLKDHLDTKLKEDKLLEATYKCWTSRLKT
jgi:hypothetical protein